jgi:hypothetical protein
MLHGKKISAAGACIVLMAGLATPQDAEALALGADFSAGYTVQSLGSVPGLPPLYGGLTFLDSDTLLVGGNANTAAGRFYTVDVVRGAGGHITGFTGSATAFGNVGEYNDGGIVFGPGGVLFTSRWPVNQLGQTKPGSTDEDKIFDLAALGVASSHAALGFVPAGFAGAGQFKLVSWSGGQFYTAALAPDGSGTYDVTSIVQEDLDPSAAGIQNVPGGPEGFVYIDGANAGFGVDSMLIAEYSAGAVGVYEIDGDGNPLVSTRRDFLTGLTGAEGSVIDPVTGDFLFSTFGGGNQIVRVTGFIQPPCGVPGTPDCQVPEPGTLPLIVLALLAALALAASNRPRRDAR